MTSTRSIWIKSLVSGGLLLIGSLVWGSQVAFLSVLVGIGVALANFWLLERLVTGLIHRESRNTKRLFVTFVVKLILVFGVIGFVVLKVPLAMGWLLLGLSCVVAGIVLEGVQGLLFGPAKTQD